jgi:hypothetical protein
MDISCLPSLPLHHPAYTSNMASAPIVVDEAEGDNMNDAQLINEVGQSMFDQRQEKLICPRSTRYGRRSELHRPGICPQKLTNQHTLPIRYRRHSCSDMAFFDMPMVSRSDIVSEHSMSPQSDSDKADQRGQTIPSTECCSVPIHLARGPIN